MSACMSSALPFPMHCYLHWFPMHWTHICNCTASGLGCTTMQYYFHFMVGYSGLHLHGGNTMSSALSDGTSFPDLHDLLSTLLPQMITSHWLTNSSENEYFAKKNQTPKIGRHSSFWRIWPKIPQMVADSSVDENFILQRKLPGTLVHVGPQRYPGHLDVWSEVKGLAVNV